MVRNERRYFIVILKKGGKLELSFLFSNKEREEYCSIRENHARPITLAQWRNIARELKAEGGINMKATFVIDEQEALILRAALIKFQLDLIFQQEDLLKKGLTKEAADKKLLEQKCEHMLIELRR